jgi:hypothetical protein
MRNTEHYKAGSGIEEHAWIHEHQLDFGTVMAIKLPAQGNTLES